MERVRTLRSLTKSTKLAYRSTPMYCGRARDVVIFGKSYVTDHPGRAVFFGQSHRDYDVGEFAAYYNREIRDETLSRPVIEQECCFIGGAKPFGHYLFEYFARISAFDKLGLLKRLPVVVYQDLPNIWLEFIELYGVPKDNILKVPRHPAPHFKSVWIARCPNALAGNAALLGQKERYTFWDDGVHDLRSRLFENSAKLVPSKTGPKRLYIGRRGASHRLLLNEDDVWRFLKTKGFEWPDLSGYSAAEQISAIRSAEVIVSVIGSGSPLTMLAPATVSILEIRHRLAWGALGSMGFAAVVGQTFTPLAAEADQKVEQEVGMEQNLTVSLGLLHYCVNLAISQTTLLRDESQQ